MDKVKAKIIESVPDVTAGCYIHHAVLMTQGITATQKMPSNVECDCNIGLAVVLRAMGKHPVAEDWKMVGWKREGIVRVDCGGNDTPLGSFFWNLEQDNYDQQSEECKQFIGSLLGV